MSNQTLNNYLTTINPNQSFRLEAQLNHKIDPMQRYEFYEDPLADELDKNKLGSVSGGGTAFNDETGIEYCDIALELTNLPQSLPWLIAFLEDQGAPKGSKITIFTEDENLPVFPFGRTEGINLTLKLAHFTEENVALYPLKEFYQSVGNLLGEQGAIEGYRETSEHVELYIYSDSNQVSIEALQPFIIEHPLCQGATISSITPED